MKGLICAFLSFRGRSLPVFHVVPVDGACLFMLLSWWQADTAGLMPAHVSAQALVFWHCHCYDK